MFVQSKICLQSIFICHRFLRRVKNSSSGVEIAFIFANAFVSVHLLILAHQFVGSVVASTRSYNNVSPTEVMPEDDVNELFVLNFGH
jgi:hypothetical protein